VTRAQALDYIRIAGYHGDKARFTTLYVENRIAYAKATAAFRAGAQQRAAGMRCSCTDCARTPPPSPGATES
jgi:hypothetical protein